MNNHSLMESGNRFLCNILSATPGTLNDFFDIVLKEILELLKCDFGFIVSCHDTKKLNIERLAKKKDEYRAEECAEYIILEYNSLFFDNKTTGKLWNVDVLIPERIGKELSGRVNKLTIIPLDKINGVTPVIVLLSFDLLRREKLEPVIGPLSSLVALYTSREMSERKMNEALEGDRRKTSYLTGFAHEIKTPLNALAGFSQLLREPLLNKEQYNKYLEIISVTSEKMINLINYFNEVSEIETGRLRILESRINLGELITEVCLPYTERFREKRIKFEKEVFFSDSTGMIIADKNKLLRILDVLLSNSFTFTYSGTVTLTARLVEGNITFCVADTGIGIPEPAKNLLFDYSDYGTSLVKNSNGSGLGLIISKSYIEMMGGKIWFESTEGQGSSFHFSIPYKHADAITDLYPKSVSGGLQNSKGRKRILVAEDDNLNFSLIKMFLSGLDVEIIRAENGKEAFDIASANKIDLVLMDIRMPVMDGYTASSLIKNINPSLKIIAQTAYSDRAMAILNGCDDCITKPFGKQQLISLVSSYL